MLILSIFVDAFDLAVRVASMCDPSKALLRRLRSRRVCVRWAQYHAGNILKLIDNPAGRVVSKDSFLQLRPIKRQLVLAQRLPGSGLECLPELGVGVRPLESGLECLPELGVVDRSLPGSGIAADGCECEVNGISNAGSVDFLANAEVFMPVCNGFSNAGSVDFLVNAEVFLPVCAARIDMPSCSGRLSARFPRIVDAPSEFAWNLDAPCFVCIVAQVHWEVVP